MNKVIERYGKLKEEIDQPGNQMAELKVLSTLPIYNLLVQYHVMTFSCVTLLYGVSPEFLVCKYDSLEQKESIDKTFPFSVCNLPRK